MSIGEFPESLSQAILAGIVLVGKLGEEHRVEGWRAASAVGLPVRGSISLLGVSLLYSESSGSDSFLRGTKGVPRKGVYASVDVRV